MLTITAKGVHADIIPILIEQMKAFGAKVTMHTVTTPAGEMRFYYDRETLTLTISVTKDHGHFPIAMLIGGIKQTVKEAAESFGGGVVFEVSKGTAT